MDQEHGSILPGDDPDPWPCPHNPIKPEIGKYSNRIGFQIIQITSFFFLLHFVWDLKDTITGGTVTSGYFRIFVFQNYNKRRAQLKPRRRAGRCRMDPHA